MMIHVRPYCFHILPVNVFPMRNRDFYMGKVLQEYAHTHHYQRQQHQGTEKINKTISRLRSILMTLILMMILLKEGHGSGMLGSISGMMLYLIDEL
jgi:hypothetical protein